MINITKLRSRKIQFTIRDGKGYFMYHGRRYHISEFMYYEDETRNWEGIMSLTNTSALLIRINMGSETITPALMY